MSLVPKRCLSSLCKPEILAQLLDYVTRDDLEEPKKFKYAICFRLSSYGLVLLIQRCSCYRYPFIASEILCCEVWPLYDALMAQPELLQKFWQFLDRPAPLDALLASHFSKVIAVLLTKKTAEVEETAMLAPNAPFANVGLLDCLSRL
jgi:serine/threonine-protein phosphatase 6 regulatory subunit 3